jgi:hypothetical protein
MVVKQPKFTRVEEPTLLCNHVPHRGDSVPNLPQACFSSIRRIAHFWDSTNPNGSRQQRKKTGWALQYHDVGRGLATSVLALGDASASKHCQGRDGPQAGSAFVLDVAKWPRVFTVDGVRFVRGTARYRTWCEVTLSTWLGIPLPVKGVRRSNHGRSLDRRDV